MTATMTDRSTSASPAQRLRQDAAAVRISFTWFGVRKTLTQEQRNQAAESFGAESDFLSARKKLLDTKHPAYKDVTAVRGKMLAYHKSVSLPYPEPGVRLIRRDRLDAFQHQMEDFKEELQDAVERLQQRYDELKDSARQRLGHLFSHDDYPASLEGLFAVERDFPNVEPPGYLMQLSPELFEQEKARVAGRFQEAVQMAEQAFLGEFSRLISHLTERLSGSPGGEKKVFRDSAIANLVEFFDRFKDLSVGSNQQLEEMVGRAQRLVQGVEASELRTDDKLRQQIAMQLSRVQSSLDGMLVDQPRRRIIRNNPVEEA
ncbi:MAG: hypothetical protein K2X38_09110 [Gemmataceae bacterium]|nr:hypothetical protein [Gemmataceae bacterium]